MRKISILLFLISIYIFLLVSSVFSLVDRYVPAVESKGAYQRYLDFFEEIYATMKEHYYHPVSRFDYDRFIKQFNAEIYSRLDQPHQWNDFISLRSGALLVDFLKNPEDVFSVLLPPHVAKEFEQEVLGKRIDLGIEGELTEEGFIVTRIEPRSDAFQKGLRLNDLIKSIDEARMQDLTHEHIMQLLTPQEGETVRIEFIQSTDLTRKVIKVLSQEYYHQTVFPVDVAVPRIFCLRIERFNRKTAEDMVNYIALINQQGFSGLILDLRGNPGGPPLAARELASFFLTPHQMLMYFQRREDTKNYLDIPEIPEQFRYSGPVMILVNEESGSAAEIFSGIMQKQGRATLVGSNTAGQVFLKSMYTLDNEAMLALVTARGYYPDGEVFSFSGVMPTYPMRQQEMDLVSFAAGYLFYHMYNEKK